MAPKKGRETERKRWFNRVCRALTLTAGVEGNDVVLERSELCALNFKISLTRLEETTSKTVLTFLCLFLKTCELEKDRKTERQREKDTECAALPQ